MKMFNHIKLTSMKTMSFLRGAAGTLLLAVLGLAALSSCNRKVPTPLDAPQPTLAAATVSSLTFSWKAVANAVEYTYELCDASDTKVESGSTKALAVTFTGLKENTTYTFKLTANCDKNDGDHEMSKTATVTGTTAKIQQLKAPAPVAKFENGVVTISWEAVENADSYSYAYGIVDSQDPVMGTTNETSLSISDLAPGDYGFAIQANSADEAYTDSEYGSCTFTVKTVEKWSAEGFVFDGAGKYWKANLVAMSDGSYSLKNWYNIEGYDLDFTVAADGAMQITNYTEGSDESYFYVNAGLESPVCLYPTGGYSKFSGDATGGEFYVYSYQTNAYFDFQWPAVEGSAVTVDELVGTYAQNSTYQFYYDGAFSDYSYEADVTIAKVDDNTVSISGLIWDETKAVNATLDASNGIIAVAPGYIDDYYVLGGASYQDVVLGYYKDGVITIDNWTLYAEYDDYFYSYTQNTKTTLTKK